MKFLTRAVTCWNNFWFAPGPASALGICRLLFFLLYNTRAYVSQRAGRGVGVRTGTPSAAAGGPADVDL